MPQDTETMVERVARASFAAWAKKRGKDYVFEDMDEEEREWSAEHARAMIGAMQVPTAAMKRAGGEVGQWASGSPQSDAKERAWEDKAATEVYVAMMKEALK